MLPVAHQLPELEREEKAESSHQHSLSSAPAFQQQLCLIDWSVTNLYQELLQDKTEACISMKGYKETHTHSKSLQGDILLC